MWIEAITDGRQWDRDRDADRIRHAFLTLARTRTSWPVPRDLLEAMPPSVAVRALPPRASDPARAKREIAKAQRLLRAPPSPARPVEVAPARPLHEVEAELRQHFAAVAEEREAVIHDGRDASDA